ncbi:hypothetical protein TcBrA4_0070290 [Trypanosoma cruzi]|nr:hypothetical protein TcBrA4_0070290 [Trypanosoma cruzi]
MMQAADPRHGRYLTASALFRGRMSTKEVDEQMLNVAETRTRPTSLSGSRTTSSPPSATSRPKGLKMAVTFVGTTPASRRCFAAWASSSRRCSRARRSCTGTRARNGRDGVTEAESNMNDLGVGVPAVPGRHH